VPPNRGDWADFGVRDVFGPHVRRRPPENKCPPREARGSCEP
jgi:hypothetical protein